MKSDVLGDRMKAYERSAETQLRPDLPICIRIDGRGFSKYTRDFLKPFDSRVSDAMRATTRALVQETNARMGYTQSDEITLILLSGPDQTPFFDGRVQKLCSVLASLAAVTFDRALKAARPPTFDARVWQVPDMETANEVLLWRALDARRNGVSSAYRAHFSAKRMKGKSAKEMLRDLRDAGVVFEEAYAQKDRLGTYMRRVTRERQIPDEVWTKIPQRLKPESQVMQRSSVEEVEMPFWGHVKNGVDVIFKGATPS